MSGRSKVYPVILEDDSITQEQFYDAHLTPEIPVENQGPDATNSQLGEIARSLGGFSTQKWREAARCKGLEPNLFHPDASDEDAISEAKAVCDLCPVKIDCLDFALIRREKDGIWGGLTIKERTSIIRKRGRAKANK